MRAQEMKRLMTMAGRVTPRQRETMLALLPSGLTCCEAIDLVQGRVGLAPNCSNRSLTFNCLYVTY